MITVGVYRDQLAVALTFLIVCAELQFPLKGNSENTNATVNACDYETKIGNPIYPCMDEQLL